MEENKCPLCKQPVSQELFEKITGIWRERRIQEKALKEKQKALIKQQRESRKIFEEEKKKFKAAQKAIVEEKVANQTKKFSSQLARLEVQKNKIQQQANKKIAIAVKVAEKQARLETNAAMKAQFAESLKKAVEKSNSKQAKDLLRKERTLESTRKQMSTLQSHNAKQQQQINNLKMQLQNQTTPQLEGLLYEDKLMEALQKDFPDDQFIHTGKGGDILQEIKIGEKTAGLIVYECKKVSQWQTAHVEQAAIAKLQRKADFAILVTNATKKGSSGFFIERNVIVINPGGVLSVAAILRDQIIKIAQLKLTQAQRDEAVGNTMRYLQGAEFKNSLEMVIRKTKEMYEDLKKECQDHLKTWKKRHDSLKSVYLHTAQVQAKTTHLISGKADTKIVETEIQQFPELPNLSEL